MVLNVRADLSVVDTCQHSCSIYSYVVQSNLLCLFYPSRHVLCSKFAQVSKEVTRQVYSCSTGKDDGSTIADGYLHCSPWPESTITVTLPLPPRPLQQKQKQQNTKKT